MFHSFDVERLLKILMVFQAQSITRAAFFMIFC
jgi:hypothetical protein